jgi:hypothetical protein
MIAHLQGYVTDICAFQVYIENRYVGGGMTSIDPTPSSDAVSELSIGELIERVERLEEDRAMLARQII